MMINFDAPDPVLARMGARRSNDTGMAGDILAARAQRLPMPEIFGPGADWLHFPVGKADTRATRSTWHTIYSTCQGYEMTWGHILEDKNAGTTFYFVPTELIQAGARTEIMAAIAIKWMQSQQALFDGYVTLVNGPACVPLALKGDIEVVHEWLGQVFLPKYFDELYSLWDGSLVATALAPAPVGETYRTRGAAIVEPVYVIHQPIAPKQDYLQLILVTIELCATVQFAMWTKAQGLTLSDRIELPSTYPHCLLSTTDFLLDFYRTDGMVISEVTMPMHEPAIANLINALLDAAAPAPETWLRGAHGSIRFGSKV